MSTTLEQLKLQDQFSKDRKRIQGAIKRTLHPVLSQIVPEFSNFLESLESGEYQPFKSTWDALLTADGEITEANDKIAEIVSRMEALKVSLEDFEALRPGILDLDLPVAPTPVEEVEVETPSEEGV